MPSIHRGRLLTTVTLTITLLTLRQAPCEAQITGHLQFDSSSESRYDQILLSQSGDAIVGLDSDTITVWETQTGKRIFERSLEADGFAFDRSSDRLIMKDPSEPRLLELKMQGDPDSWTSRPLMANTNDYKPIAVSPNGQYLACSISYDSFGVVDLSTKKVVLRHEHEYIQHVAFSPKSDAVAITLDRKEDALIQYSLPDGKRLATAAFIASASQLAYDPNGSLLAVSCTMGGSNSVALLDTTRLRPVRSGQFKVSNSPQNTSIAWSCDGSLLAVSSAAETYESIGIFDVVSKRQLCLLHGYDIKALQFLPNQDRLLSSDREGPGIVIWDWKSTLQTRQANKIAATHPLLTDDGDDGKVPLELAYSPDGKHLALALPQPYYYIPNGEFKSAEIAGVKPEIDFNQLDRERSYIFILDASSGKPIKAMNSHDVGLRVNQSSDSRLSGSQFCRLDFSHDGKTLASLLSSGQEGHLVLWDVSTVRPTVQMRIAKESDTWRSGWLDLAFAPDRQSLILLSSDRSEHGIQRLNLQTSSVDRSLPGEVGQTLSFLTDNQVASGFATWDLSTGEPLICENSGHAAHYHSVKAISPTALVGLHDAHRQLAHFDLETLKVTYPYAAHRGSYSLAVSALAVSKDGQFLATGCFDHQIRVWEAATGRLRLTLTGHSHTVDAVCFAPNALHLASASRDGTTRFWDLSDLSSHEAQLAAPQIPTSKRFKTMQGADITIAFDRPAQELEIIAALEETLSKLRPNPAQP